MKIRAFRESDRDEVIELWRICDLLRPWNNPRKDIERKASTQSELFLVGFVDDQLVASVMGGYDGHRGWINYLAVDPKCRRLGYARTIIEEVERRLAEIGCPKVNLQVRQENVEAIAFYQKIGFSEDRVVSLGKRLQEDN